MKLQDCLKDGKIKVQKGCFAMIKAKRANNNAFAQIFDGTELTLFIEHSFMNDADIIESEKNLRILTFDMKFQFETYGVIAEIATLLAEVSISIFFLSGFSTDHLVIKNSDYEKTIDKFKEVGFEIIE
jgi:hypothetical protein